MFSERKASILRGLREEHLLAVLMAAILAVGGYGWWRERQRAEIADRMFQDMMGHGTEVHGPDPFAYLLYTFLAASAMVGVYLVSRRYRGTEQVEEPTSSPSPLDLLPGDERKVLTPVVETPGLTQVELRGRSDFSKSKISQVVTGLEERGLLYREPQGRTYRIYPGELVENLSASPRTS